MRKGKSEGMLLTLVTISGNWFNLENIEGKKTIIPHLIKKKNVEKGSTLSTTIEKKKIRNLQ